LSQQIQRPLAHRQNYHGTRAQITTYIQGTDLNNTYKPFYHSYFILDPL